MELYAKPRAFVLKRSWVPCIRGHMCRIDTGFVYNLKCCCGLIGQRCGSAHVQGGGGLTVWGENGASFVGDSWSVQTPAILGFNMMTKTWFWSS